MRRIYLKILAFYLAAGIAVSGYLRLYPIYHKIKIEHSWGDETGYEIGNEQNVAVLITIIGCLLIVGLGIITKKNE